MRIRLILAAATVFTITAAARAGTPVLAKGVLLVAVRGLPDPNFAETVVILTDYSRRGAMGLVINRPGTKRIAELLPQWKQMRTRADRVFIGGPVEGDAVIALAHSEARPDEARSVIDKVWLLNTRTALESAIAAKIPVRLFAGYAGWAAGQLDSEIEAGAWKVLPANAQLVFEKDPATVWEFLIMRTEAILARILPWAHSSTAL